MRARAAAHNLFAVRWISQIGQTVPLSTACSPAFPRCVTSKHLSPFSTSSPPSSSSSSSPSSKDKQQLFLHVGPSGDCWTGTSLFAAKHLQPDYVRSIPLHNKDDICVETLLEILEENSKLAQEIYDNQTLPQEVLEQAKKVTNDD